MGLPNSGKTTFARMLVNALGRNNKTVVWFNADDVRRSNKDWDFSKEGRVRQAKRMKDLADSYNDLDYVVCDFVAPLREMRDIFAADYTVWMDTISESEYADTNIMFEEPQEFDMLVRVKDAQTIVKSCLPQILKLK